VLRKKSERRQRVRPIFFTRSREAAKKEKLKNSGREQLLATQLPGNLFDLLPLLRLLA
jgi:transcriptional regulator of acetoin/glycerol metabolism